MLITVFYIQLYDIYRMKKLVQTKKGLNLKEIFYFEFSLTQFIKH